MTTRRKYFYALEADWPDVLADLESAVDVEYLNVRVRLDWTFQRYQAWSDLPIKKLQGEIFWHRYLIATPPGIAIKVPLQPNEEKGRLSGGSDDPLNGWRPTLEETPGTVLFDPRGYDPEISAAIGEPFIDEGWIATMFYEDKDSKAIYDVLLKAMTKRFANLKGTLFGPNAYREISENGWKYGQGGPLDLGDLLRARKPTAWKGNSGDSI